MEKYILAFHKDVFRFIKFLFVDIPAYLGLAACTVYLVIGAAINFLCGIDRPIVKMGLIGAELKEEERRER